MRKRNKYGNKKVSAFGRTFDSVGERDRYFFLSEAEKRGEIRKLQCQVPYHIVIHDELICKYIADFVYEKHNGYKSERFECGNSFGFCGGEDWRTVVEDFKGFATPEYKLKAKLMRAVHGIEIKVVKKPTDAIG